MSPRSPASAAARRAAARRAPPGRAAAGRAAAGRSAPRVARPSSSARVDGDAETAAARPVNLANRSVQRILDAALAVWSRAGYHGASLQDVADEAGVAKSLVHYHFASKEHLLLELQAVHFRAIAASVRARLERRRPSTASAMDALDEVWDALRRSRSQFPFALEVWRASLQSDAIRARLVAFDAEMAHLVRDGVHAALGPLAPRLALPADRVAALLHVALDGFTLRLFLADKPARLRRVYDDFKLLLAALLPPAERGPT